MIWRVGYTRPLETSDRHLLSRDIG